MSCRIIDEGTPNQRQSILWDKIRATVSSDKQADEIYAKAFSIEFKEELGYDWTATSNSQKTFTEIENVSNMIINKLLTKEGAFYKKNSGRAKEDFFYNTESQIKTETEREVISNIFKYFDSIESLNSKDDSEILDFLENKIKELELIKTEQYNERYANLEYLYSIRRVINSFSTKNNKESISEYDKNQQDIIRTYFPKLFNENNYKTEKQAFFHQSTRALKKINRQIEHVYNNKAFLGINSIIKKIKVASDFVEIIPNWRELLNKKIENEYSRRLEYKTKNLKENVDLQKTIEFRKLWKQADFFSQELEFQKSFKFLSAHKKRIKSVFKDYDSSREIMSSTNSVEVLNTIANGNSEYKNLAKSLIGFAEKNNVEIVVLNNSGFNSGVSGSYITKIGQIVNSKGEAKASFVKNQIITLQGTSKRFAVNPEQLVLHEIVHSLSAILLASESYIKNGESIFDKYLNYLNRASIKLRDMSGFFFNLSGPYGFTNPSELFSEVLTNLEFREMLKLIPAINSKEYRNFLEEFLDKVIDYISKIFKKTENYENALEELEDLIYNTFEAQSNMPMNLESVLNSLEGDLQDYKVELNTLKNKQITNSNQINYVLKSVDILSSDKAKQVFEKGKKNGWDLNKILTKLQVPKEQKQIILDKKEQLDSSYLYRVQEKGFNINETTIQTYENKLNRGETLKWFQQNILNDPERRKEFESRDKHYGQWFTDNITGLQYYLDDKEDIEILRVKVPKNLLGKFNVGESGSEDAKKWSLRHHDEYIVPRDIIEKADKFSRSDIEKLREIEQPDLREEIITSLLAESTFVVEVNTAKDSIKDPYNRIDQEVREINNKELESVTGGRIGQFFIEMIDESGDPDIRIFNSKIEAEKALTTGRTESNSKHYSNLTVPGGTNYTENEIATPAITPSIKGHAQFSTDNGLGWWRTDEKIQYTEQDVDSLIDILKNSGQLEINCK